MTELIKCSILRWNLCEIQTQKEIIVDIRRREVTRSWYYVTQPSNDVNMVGLSADKNFIGQNSRSSNPEATERKSRVTNWKSIPVDYRKSKALNVRSVSKHAN